MIRTDADFILAVASLLRILAEGDPTKRTAPWRTAHLAAYAERRELRTEDQP